MFTFAQAKSPPELLHEDPPTMRDTSETDDIHIWNIYALVKEINCS
ncbi:hypothetical protein FAGKG844_880008 [Frankia sp. AgKG'84/4]